MSVCVTPAINAVDVLVVESPSAQHAGFSALSSGARTVHVALRWISGSWKIFTLAGAARLPGTAVLGRADAWALAQAPSRARGPAVPATASAM